MVPNLSLWSSDGFHREYFHLRSCDLGQMLPVWRERSLFTCWFVSALTNCLLSDPSTHQPFNLSLPWTRNSITATLCKVLSRVTAVSRSVGSSSMAFLFSTLTAWVSSITLWRNTRILSKKSLILSRYCGNLLRLIYSQFNYMMYRLWRRGGGSPIFTH